METTSETRGNRCDRYSACDKANSFGRVTVTILVLSTTLASSAILAIIWDPGFLIYTRLVSNMAAQLGVSFQDLTGSLCLDLEKLNMD